MKKVDLDIAMKQAGFAPDIATGGYRRGELWLSASQARGALCSAEDGEAWTEESVEPLSETLARSLTSAGIA